MFIPDPDPDFLPIPYPGSRGQNDKRHQIPYPGYGFATLYVENPEFEAGRRE
jgi:hypothetical protein